MPINGRTWYVGGQEVLTRVVGHAAITKATNETQNKSTQAGA
jgi:hypothetical protein